MPPKTQRRKNAKDISIRDVVNHMTGMEQRISGKIESNTKGIASNTKVIETNAVAIQDVKETLTRRIDALEEDLTLRCCSGSSVASQLRLTAHILDAVQIRRHVGMPVPSES